MFGGNAVGQKWRTDPSGADSSVLPVGDWMDTLSLSVPEGVAGLSSWWNAAQNR